MPLKKVELLRLGRRIRRERQLLGFSQKGFATKCGLDRSYLGGVERGNRNVTFGVLCEICDGLNCDIAAVTRGIPHPPTPPVATDANQSLEQRTRGGVPPLVSAVSCSSCVTPDFLTHSSIKRQTAQWSSHFCGMAENSTVMLIVPPYAIRAFPQPAFPREHATVLFDVQVN